ncbi:hypothetical protein HNP87_001456 [Methanococcus maripaludis]|uniref:Uncharacterized protein n=1 Tax=Methanococcus maripaludis TaxID=39152 RepID=A0A7J9NJ33_METMI|nr:hypothetical protein [Methanococcus maripaludis]MBA2840924.1 hypothetical protein [Methanococcus maripaludis]
MISKVVNENTARVLVIVNHSQSIDNSELSKKVFGKYEGELYSNPIAMIDVIHENRVSNIFQVYKDKNGTIILKEEYLKNSGSLSKVPYSRIQVFEHLGDLLEIIDKSVKRNQIPCSTALDTYIDDYLSLCGLQYSAPEIPIFKAFKDKGYEVYRPFEDIPKNKIIEYNL